MKQAQDAAAKDRFKDPFAALDDALSGIFVSMGRGLGQTMSGITEGIADIGSSLGSALFGEQIAGVVGTDLPDNKKMVSNKPTSAQQERNKEAIGTLVEGMLLNAGIDEYDENGKELSFQERWDKMSNGQKLLTGLIIAQNMADNNDNRYNNNDFESLDQDNVVNRLMEMAANGRIELNASSNAYNSKVGFFESILNFFTGDSFKPSIDISETATKNPLALALSLIHEGTHAVDYNSPLADVYSGNTLYAISEMNARINEMEAYKMTGGGFSDMSASGFGGDITFYEKGIDEGIRNIGTFYLNEYDKYQKDGINGIIQNLQDMIRKNLPGFEQYRGLPFKNYKDYREAQCSTGMYGNTTEDFDNANTASDLMNSNDLEWPFFNGDKSKFNNYMYYKQNYNRMTERMGNAEEYYEYNSNQRPSGPSMRFPFFGRSVRRRK